MSDRDVCKGEPLQPTTVQSVIFRLIGALFRLTAVHFVILCFENAVKNIIKSIVLFVL